MKQIDDGDGNLWWVPKSDNHWQRVHPKTEKPFINKYQYSVIEEAYKHIEIFNLAIDCGANVGTHAKKFAEDFKKVISYEPAPDCFKCLKENTKNLENIILKRMAVGDYTGIASMDYKPIKVTGQRQIRPEVNELSNKLKIDIIKLDDDADAMYPNLIKLDVQGFETCAIIGAEHVIKISHPIIICEVEEERKLPYLHNNPMDAINLLKKWDYKIKKQIRRDYIMVWDCH